MVAHGQIAEIRKTRLIKKEANEIEAVKIRDEQEMRRQKVKWRKN